MWMDDDEVIPVAQTIMKNLKKSGAGKNCVDSDQLANKNIPYKNVKILYLECKDHTFHFLLLMAANSHIYFKLIGNFNDMDRILGYFSNLEILVMVGAGSLTLHTYFYNKLPDFLHLRLKIYNCPKTNFFVLVRIPPTNMMLLYLKNFLQKIFFQSRAARVNDIEHNLVFSNCLVVQKITKGINLDLLAIRSIPKLFSWVCSFIHCFKKLTNVDIPLLCLEQILVKTNHLYSLFKRKELTQLNEIFNKKNRFGKNLKRKLDGENSQSKRIKLN